MPVLERLKTVPSWMLLSLAMNGLLFMAVVFGLRQSPTTPGQSGLVVPQARASTTDSEEPLPLVPQLGDRQYLTYQQWVDLLRQEAQAYRQAPRLTVLLGDSITLWFPQELLPRDRTWLNQAISGESADRMIQRLEDLDDAEIETLFLMIGVNDLIAGKPENEVVRNIRASVRYLKKQHPNTTIVLQAILPHGAEGATWEGRDRLLQLPNERILAVNQALEKVAEEEGVHYLDLYTLFVDNEGKLRLDLSTDGLHLNDRGYLVWRTAILLLLSNEVEG